MKTSRLLLLFLLLATGCQRRPGAESPQACLDRWLATRNLDPYGAPAGTVYAGGTPLFDERTGLTRSRADWVYSLHPEARTQCGGEDGGQTGVQ